MGLDTATAERAEAMLLNEIERLRAIFSTYDAASELSQLNRHVGPFNASADLVTVLRDYEHWARHSHGICSAQTQAFMACWHDAERTQCEPTPTVLAELLHATQGTPWTIDGHTVTRHTTLPLNLNALAKGYILHQATHVLRQTFPTLASVVMNLGGDLVVQGEPVLVGVQDPATPWDNARPLTLLRLQNKAIATSGGYQRGFTIDGRRYSHLIDPRTGRPAEELQSATVLAADSRTANALATTCASGSAAEALRLVARTPGTECLLVDAAGVIHRSAGFAAWELTRTDTPDDPPKKDAPAVKEWPSDFVVNIALELPQPMGRAKRPYVAIWFENDAGKPVRTVTVWGNSSRWIRDLSVWWKFAKDDAALVKAVSRATRAPGKYEVVWDGKDDAGKPVPQGTYTVKVEVHREHGKHLTQIGTIKCLGEATKVTLDKNAETGDTVVDYRKKK